MGQQCKVQEPCWYVYFGQLTISVYSEYLWAWLRPKTYFKSIVGSQAPIQLLLPAVRNFVHRSNPAFYCSLFVHKSNPAFYCLLCVTLQVQPSFLLFAVHNIVCVQPSFLLFAVRNIVFVQPSFLLLAVRNIVSVQPSFLLLAVRNIVCIQPSFLLLAVHKPVRRPPSNFPLFAVLQVMKS